MSPRKPKRLRIARKLWNYEGALPPGSDGRVKGGIFKRCILCGRHRQLRLSHIIPRWAYTWHRQSWNGKIKGLYLSIGAATEEQDGNKHYLMCDSCEQLASKDESYVRVLVAGSRTEKRQKRIFEWRQGSFLWLDTAAISRFVSITALRCHYAPSAPFHDISIPRHFRTLLRRKVFCARATSELPLVAAARFVPPKNDPDHDPRCDIFAQFEDNAQLGPLFASLIGGWEWYLFFRPDVSFTRSLRLRRRFCVRIASLPYNEYRLFARLPEIAAKYADKLTNA